MSRCTGADAADAFDITECVRTRLAVDPSSDELDTPVF